MQDKVKSYILPLYSESPTTSSIIDSAANALQTVENSLNSVLDQYFVDTATEEGLRRAESFVGIVTDETKPFYQRRSIIIGKMRGIGTVTISLIESVAESWDRGNNIEVTEQPALYQITIKFVDTLGAPTDLNSMKKALREIVPAHLDIKYEYKYLLINQVHQVMTISEMQTRKLTDFAPFIPV